MKKGILILSFILFWGSPVFAAPLSPTPVPIKFYEAKIKHIKSAAIGRTITVEVTEGSLKGKTYDIIMDTTANAAARPYHIGDAVQISYTTNPDGSTSVFITDYIRKNQLLILFIIFICTVILVGRWQGITSFIGMIFSFVIITRLIIPNILLGNDPIFISLLGAFFIIPVTFLLAHGMSKKTFVAIGGTLISLTLTAFLAYTFIELSRLTGLADEEATYLIALKGAAINMKNLLLSGIIIAALGVLDDITISQTSVVESLHKANPKYGVSDLYKHGMAVGRDHIASLVNTLVLVYAGASLPLFLLFYNAQISYGQVINQEIVAVEIVRTLVSSIGIIAAVPITTILASVIEKKK
jgi:uncharacterized membrane protein